MPKPVTPSYSYFDRPEGTNATLVITNAQSSDRGNYRVVITNSLGAITSDVAHLEVILSMFISAYGQPTNFALVCVGASVTNRVIVSGAVPLSYQWRFNGAPLEGQTKSTIILTNLQLTDAGEYDVVVANMCGSVTSTGRMLVVQVPQFEDMTVSAGITNAPGYCLSAAWGDYDNDQFVDLYLAIGADTSRINALFRNNRNGTFTRIGSAAGPITTDVHDSLGCAWIDFNNDGHRDLFVLNGGWALSRNDLYWNNGDGTFRRGNVGNLTQLSLIRGWSAIADYDGDGWVDLYIPEGVSGAYSPRLYHATSSGTFFISSNLSQSLANINSAGWGDYDNDGDPDLFTCNSSVPGVLWRNDGGGHFTAATNGPPTALASHAAWADYDRDGDLDIAIRRSGGTLSSLYRNDGASGFTLAADWPEASGVIAWADYDNDGHLDVIINAGQNITRKPALYHNNGDGTFNRAVDVFTEVADNLLGCPWGDYDNDGFMDLFFGHQYGRPKLFRNLGNTNHWVKFNLVGTTSNRDAIGAKVRVLATIAGQSAWQMQEVNGGYAMQNDTRPNFGLGDATNVDVLRIEWPSGIVEEFTNIVSKQILTIVEPSLRGSLGQDSKFHVLMTMSTNRVYQLQASTNLVDWTVVTNCTGSGSCMPVEYVDPELPTAGTARFYRMK
jgi:hypothetical protein